MNAYDFATTLAQDERMSSKRANGRVALAAPQAPVSTAHGASCLQTLSPSELRTVRNRQLDAFRYALPCAYDKRVVAAIHAAWDSMEAGQP